MTEQAKPNFILGRGENLTAPVPYQNRDSRTSPPYSLAEQKAHLTDLLQTQEVAFGKLPDDACPAGQVVSAIALHPQYYSRSSFPERLLRDFDLRLVGSKPCFVKPRSGRGSDSDEGIPSTMLYIAGARSAFSELTKAVLVADEDDSYALDLLKIEGLHALNANERLFGPLPRRKSPLEIIVHFDVLRDAGWENDFLAFAETAGIELDFASNYQSRGLLFIPAMGDARSAERLAQFTFVRGIRPMPRLRLLDQSPVIRAVRTRAIVQLPSEAAIDPKNTVAVFDGGLPRDHPFGLWAQRLEPGKKDGIGSPIPELLEHGMAVTSAVLFGHLNGATPERPYCSVDHYRVLGSDVTDRSLYRVMLYVDQILSQSTYNFATFSFGPNEVAGDDKVTAWTAMLDDHLGSSDLLATVAVGNVGHLPWPECRILVPSDSVNAIAVGASDAPEGAWKRAPYSCIGPGRHPGTVKPDLVHFGGTEEAPFRFAFPGGAIAEDYGTSYATPAVMRIAAGLRAHFGTSLTPLAIRALLIHSADPGAHSQNEVGWGLIPSDLGNIVVCPDGVVRILYQGKLSPSKVIRASIPLPKDQLSGKVRIRATFCYTCPTDPHTPGDYTRAGLEVTFRPHSGKGDNPAFPKPASFFKRHSRSNEQDLRMDAHKWDTVLHNEVKKNGASLMNPVFDIHYLAREPGTAASPSRAMKLSYALVVTIEAANHADLYSKVASRYANRLSMIRPKLDLPIRVA